MVKGPKIRVAVLYGGRSGEHEVSLVSAAYVAHHLDRTQFEVVPIGIDKQGSWFLGEEGLSPALEGISRLTLTAEQERMVFNPELLAKPQAGLTPARFIGEAKKHEALFDVVFPVIHGVNCEDGVVQGLLELAEVPYVGCGVLASAVGMDKDVSKRLVQAAGVLVPPYLTLKRGQWERYAADFCDLVNQRLTYPVFVKPANTGSSVGVAKVKSPEQLVSAIEQAFRYDTKIVVEQGINAREMEVAVLEGAEYGSEPIVSVVGEVRPTSAHEFYSYESKYLDENGAELFIPADISAELQKQIQQVARQVFNILECEGMARVDLFLERDTNRIYFNEVNTIPGFTSISMYPKLMAASGITYPELLKRLIDLAIKRHTRKTQLLRNLLPVE